MGVPVIHFEIMGGQGSQLEKFYGELFGWKINSNNPMKYGVVDTGGGPGGINGGVGANQDGSKRVSVYAQVDDLQTTLDKVEKLGGIRESARSYHTKVGFKRLWAGGIICVWWHTYRVA